MKKIGISILLLGCLACTSAQNQRPTKSRFWNNKASTFTVKAGDILVYRVNNNGDEYDFIVKLKKYGPVINFDFSMPQKGTKANVNIQAAAVKNAVKYNNYFNSTNKNLANESSVWLSQKNFRDVASEDKETRMDVGSGDEKFTTEKTTTQTINYKGKQKIVTVYKLVNENAGDPHEINVLTELANPLILSMNLGWTITLKEVR